MSWENPVTTWGQAGQTVPGGGDFNRIEGNTQYLKDEVDAHKAENTQQAHLAKNIWLEDAAGNFVANNIEGAMSELFTNVSNGKQLVGRAITDVDDSVVIPADPTFQQLADAIGNISTGKKWAEGTIPNTPAHEEYTYTVSGLDFTPSIIVVTGAWNYGINKRTVAWINGYGISAQVGPTSEIRVEAVGSDYFQVWFHDGGSTGWKNNKWVAIG